MRGRVTGVGRATGDRFVKFVGEALKLRWPLAIGLAIFWARSHGWLLPNSQWTIVADKTFYIVSAYVLASIATKQTWPYEDAGELLARATRRGRYATLTDAEMLASSHAFRAVAIKRGAVFAATVIAYAVGY